MQDISDFFDRDRIHRRRKYITYFALMLDAVKVIGAGFGTVGIFVMMPAVYTFNSRG